MDFFDPFGPTDAPSRGEPQKADATISGHDRAPEERSPSHEDALPGRRWSTPSPAGSFPRTGGAPRPRQPATETALPTPQGQAASGRSPDTPPRSAPARRDPFDPFAPAPPGRPEPSASPDPDGGRRTVAERTLASASREEDASGGAAPSVASGAAAEVPPVLSQEWAVARLREIARPALRSALGLLAQHGHEAELVDRLDRAERPGLAVRLQPSVGPLRASPGPPSSEFEIHLVMEARPGGRPGEEALPDRFQVRAGHTVRASDAGSTDRDRVDVRDLTRDWVTDRFVGFVRQALDRA